MFPARFVRGRLRPIPAIVLALGASVGCNAQYQDVGTISLKKFKESPPAQAPGGRPPKTGAPLKDFPSEGGGKAAAARRR